MQFFLILFALVCILDELFMTWTGSYPINQIAQNWSLQNAPAGWVEIRTQWLCFVYWRCALLLVGFGLLLVSVFSTKSESPLSQDVAAAF